MKFLFRLARRYARQRARISLQCNQFLLRAEIDRIKSEIRRTMPDNPMLSGFKVYAQTDEDGIIAHIFRQIGGGHTFIEFGCGNGLENNTHFLLLQGWRGVWIDASAPAILSIRNALGAALVGSQRLRVEHCFIRRDNVAEIIARTLDFVGTPEPDLFSLDIDGNDFVVLRDSLQHMRPKVLCIEYNPKFPPPVRLAVAYYDDFSWANDDYQGASLQMFCDALDGYRLVCCSIAGANAFFVRADLAHHLTSYPIEDLYQPARFDLIHLASGHEHSLHWLRDALADAKKDGQSSRGTGDPGGT